MLNRFYNSASFVVSRYQVLQIHTEHPGKVTDLQEYLTDNGMEVVDLISNCNCKLVIILFFVINMHSQLAWSLGVQMMNWVHLLSKCRNVLMKHKNELKTHHNNKVHLI